MAGPDDSPFLAACRREVAEHTPVWFMRQAGRSLPEYRQRRGAGTILSAIRDPELAAELTLQPVRRYGVDAAILFSDIMVPVAATGFGVDIVAGIGPVADQPFRGPADLRRLGTFDPATDSPWVLETVRILARESAVPLIGFAGGPFTIASYLVEGRPSRDHAQTKALMYRDPATWFALMDALADQALAMLRAQVEAGAAAVQLFDSWVGALAPVDYRRYVLPATARIFAGLAGGGVPRIHFGVTTGELLASMAESGAEVIGVDWRVPLADAWQRVGADRAVQGNLDPAACLGPWPLVAERTRAVLAAAGGRPGHVFNLGHGVLPETDPGILAEVVALVHEETRRSAL